MREDITTLAGLLGLPQEHHGQLERYIQRLEQSCKQAGVLEELLQHTEQQWQQALTVLGLSYGTSAEEVHAAVLQRLRVIDDAVWNTFNQPNISSAEGWQSVVNELTRHVPATVQQGFFLRHSVAQRLLREHPPQEIIDYFGYAGVEELLEKEGVEDVYAALRFGVSEEWNNGFLEQYAALTPQDFEQRDTRFIILQPEKWFTLAREFAKKKLHPSSHLKEMGIIFAIPNPEAVDSNRQRTLTTIVSLTLHYYFEVHFYAQYMDVLQTTHAEDFGRAVQQMVLGNTLAEQIPEHGVRITHQYYTKKKNPPTVAYEPHVMPEPLHWYNACAVLQKILQNPVMDEWSSWYTTGHVVKGELVSLNVEDVVVSNAERKSYHLTEALWNRLYTGFCKNADLQQLFIRHMDTGIIPFE